MLNVNADESKEGAVSGTPAQGLDRGDAVAAAAESPGEKAASGEPSRVQAREAIPYALAALSGVLYFTGFVHFGLWPLAFVCFVPLLLALRSAKGARNAFLLSWCMGTSTFLGGYYWLIHLFTAFADFPLVASAPLYLLFCLLQGLQFAVIGTATWLVSRKGGVSMGWVLPAALCAGEAFLPLFFQSYLANSFAYVPLMIQPADIGGVTLVSFIVASVSGALFEVIASRLDRRPFPWQVVLASAALVAFDLSYSARQIDRMERRDASATQVKTAIIQANIGGETKHLDIDAGIERYKAMTADILAARDDIGLVVWPESAFNKIVRSKMNLTGFIADRVRIPMVVGLLREQVDAAGGESQYFNTMAAVAPGGRIVGFYDKVILVAFGEYLPAEDVLKPLYEILPFSSSFTHGRSFEPLQLGSMRLSADICYEDIVAGHMRRLMAPNAAGHTPNAMVNVTNDSWYGPAEPRIHLALSVFRAVEHRRWLIRSTATGISAFVDSVGRVVEKSPFEAEATLVADVPMVEDGPTFYGRWGDWLAWASLAFMALTLAIARFRRRDEVEKKDEPEVKKGKKRFQRR